MKQISLRLPDDVHAAVKELARREHRSLHGQVVHILRECVDHEDRPSTKDAVWPTTPSGQAHR